MIKTIAGFILLSLPYFFIPFSRSPKKSLVLLLFFSLCAYSLSALFLQAFKLFSYQNILLSLVFFDLIFLFFLLKNGVNFKPKIDPYLVVVIFLAFFTLYQVHYNYTGKINLATDFVVNYHEVKNFKYPYPYFSDEWYAVLLINYAIKTGKLPLWDPINNIPFLNFEIFFHSLLSYLFLVLNLSPLHYYTLFTIFFNTLIILLLYLFFRINDLEKRASAVISLSALYITCGANLPGLWYLIPVNLGIIFFLIASCFLSLGLFKKTFLAFLFSALFYPPFAIFNFIAFTVQYLILKSKKEKKVFLFILLSFILLALFFWLKIPADWKKTILNRLFYISFYGPETITHISFYQIIPLPIVLLGAISLVKISKSKLWLVATFFLTIIFWFFYSSTAKRIIIEYERNVFLSSLLLVMLSAFGWTELKNYLKKSFNISMLFDWIEIGILVLFLLFIPFYTQRERWKNIIIENKKTGQVYHPKAPANNYLTQDDLNIFQDIRGKRFLSFPWKGTVIGIATENIPLVAKEGNLAVGNPEIIERFLKADCKEKLNLAKKMKIDYIYLFGFDCPGFEKINESKEGLVLYKVK